METIPSKGLTMREILTNLAKAVYILSKVILDWVKVLAEESNKALEKRKEK